MEEITGTGYSLEIGCFVRPTVPMTKGIPFPMIWTKQQTLTFEKAEPRGMFGIFAHGDDLNE